MKGLIHIYTGDGKGKTTAALGLISRAVGHKFKCCYVSFHKDPAKYEYGEIKVLKRLKVEIYHFAKTCPYFDKKVNIEELKKEIEDAIAFVKTKIFDGDYDLVVLDEILICVREKFINAERIIELIKSKPKKLELVLTGQSTEEINNKLKNYADYITFMQKLKHPYDLGVKRRKGIEY